MLVFRSENKVILILLPHPLQMPTRNHGTLHLLKPPLTSCLSHLHIISTFNMGAAVTFGIQCDRAFIHEEADVTIISYMLQTVDERKKIVAEPTCGQECWDVNITEPALSLTPNAFSCLEYTP